MKWKKQMLALAVCAVMMVAMVSTVGAIVNVADIDEEVSDLPKPDVVAPVESLILGAPGDIIHTIPAPSSWCHDLAWDGEYLWVCNEGIVYQVDSSDGTVLKSIAAPSSDPAGLTWDGQYLWISDYSSTTVYQVDPNDGSVVNTIVSPITYGAGGLAWDGEALWAGGFGSSSIYRLSPSDGSIITTIPSPGAFTRGLTWGRNHLWVVDSNSDIDDIYEVNPSDGSVIWSFVPSGLTSDWFIFGLAWDGQYLWNNEKYSGVINQIDIGFTPGPSVSVTTDRDVYHTGDTMIRHLEIDNPTASSVTFNMYLGVPQFAYWGTMASASIPAEFSYADDLPFPVGDWGPAPFGMVWYVELTDGTGEVLDSDVATCAYSPGVAVSKTSDAVGAIEESIRRAGQ